MIVSVYVLFPFSKKINNNNKCEKKMFQCLIFTRGHGLYTKLRSNCTPLVDQIQLCGLLVVIQIGSLYLEDIMHVQRTMHDLLIS